MIIMLVVMVVVLLLLLMMMMLIMMTTSVTFKTVILYHAFFSTRLLAFDLTVKWALPYLGVILPCSILAFCKVWSARRKATPSGEIILQQLPGSSGSHAYTERVAAFQNRSVKILILMI
jgi:hypothetical protein